MGKHRTRSDLSTKSRKKFRRNQAMERSTGNKAQDSELSTAIMRGELRDHVPLAKTQQKEEPPKTTFQPEITNREKIKWMLKGKTPTRTDPLRYEVA